MGYLPAISTFGSSAYTTSVVFRSEGCGYHSTYAAYLSRQNYR